jgi:hypothetical protein
VSGCSRRSSSLAECGRRDSNPQGLDAHRLLRPACLPVPPRPRSLSVAGRGRPDRGPGLPMEPRGCGLDACGAPTYTLMMPFHRRRTPALLLTLALACAGSANVTAGAWAAPTRAARHAGGTGRSGGTAAPVGARKPRHRRRAAIKRTKRVPAKVRGRARSQPAPPARAPATEGPEERASLERQQSEEAAEATAEAREEAETAEEAH